MGNRFLVPNAVQGGMTLLGTQTLTAGGITFSAIPNTFRDLRLIIRNFLPATDNTGIGIRFNSDSTANRYFTTATNNTAAAFNATYMSAMSVANDNAVANGLIQYEMFDYANTTTWKTIRYFVVMNDATTTTSNKYAQGAGIYNQTAVISAITLFAESGNFTSGTALLYGVN